MISEFSSDGQIQLHYHELAEHLPNSLLFILDRHLHVVFAGGSLLAKSSWPRAAIVGMPLAGIMPAAAYSQAEPHLLAALGGSEQSYALRYPSGEVFDVRAAPLTGAATHPQQLGRTTGLAPLPAESDSETSSCPGALQPQST